MWPSVHTTNIRCRMRSSSRLLPIKSNSPSPSPNSIMCGALCLGKRFMLPTQNPNTKLTKPVKNAFSQRKSRKGAYRSEHKSDRTSGPGPGPQILGRTWTELDLGQCRNGEFIVTFFDTEIAQPLPSSLLRYSQRICRSVRT
jgi:hypothetical protein